MERPCRPGSERADTGGQGSCAAGGSPLFLGLAKHAIRLGSTDPCLPKPRPFFRLNPQSTLQPINVNASLNLQSSGCGLPSENRHQDMSRANKLAPEVNR